MVTITVTAKIRKPGTALVAVVAALIGAGAVTTGAHAQPATPAGTCQAR